MSRKDRLDPLKKYFSRKALITAQIDVNSIQTLIERLEITRENAGRVFIAGNGGSAATAEHFAVDLGVGSHIRAKEKAINVIALTLNTAVLTALGNDLNFEFIFSKQLEVHCPSKDDLVLAISASGNSPNILHLLEMARSLKTTSCAMTGFDGGKAKSLADISIHIPTEWGEYGIVEDLHLSICHAITEILRK